MMTYDLDAEKANGIFGKGNGRRTAQTDRREKEEHNLP
jgi:hypothetical protein